MDDKKQFDTESQNESLTEVKYPSLYYVLILNDDFTPQDFVVQILQDVFHKDANQSYEIMLKVHNEGKGIAGVYPKGVAETKAFIVHQTASQHKHPLRCQVISEEDEL